MTSIRSKEHGIQAAIMRYLDMALPASYRAFAVPNGGKRDKRLGEVGARGGFVPSVLFIALVWRGLV